MAPLLQKRAEEDASAALPVSSENKQSEKSTDFKDWPNEAGFGTESDQKTPIELQITGKFPAAVAGTLYRTGPAFHSIDDGPKGKFSLSHWFDGFATVYRFQIEPTDQGDCKVVFNSHGQVDPLLEYVRKTGKLDGFSFGQKRDPCESFFQKLKSIFEPRHKTEPNAHNVAVTVHPLDRHDGSDQSKGMLLRTDNTELKRIDMETLEPIGTVQQEKLHPDLTGPVSCAHAQFDPETGDCYNFNLTFGRKPVYRIFRTSRSTGKTEIVGTVKGEGVLPAYIHSFFLTKNFAILCVWPSYYSAGGVKVLWERNLLDAMAFNPDAESHWYVIDRRNGHGLVSHFTSPSMFSFHTINAYEVETSTPGVVDIVADLVEFENMDVLHRMYYDNLTSRGRNTASFISEHQNSLRPNHGCYRFRSIPLNGSTLLLTPTSPKPPAEKISFLPGPAIGELPTMNPLYATHPHRFIYSICDRGLSSFFDGIVKTDRHTQSATYWGVPKHTPGEPIFVPDPARAEKEDGGYLLSVILNGEKGESYLLCLDAESMQEVGRANAQTAVGFGFHGVHVQEGAGVYGLSVTRPGA